MGPQSILSIRYRKLMAIVPDGIYFYRTSISHSFSRLQTIYTRTWHFAVHSGFLDRIAAYMVVCMARSGYARVCTSRQAMQESNLYAGESCSCKFCTCYYPGVISSTLKRQNLPPLRDSIITDLRGLLPPHQWTYDFPWPHAHFARDHLCCPRETYWFAMRTAYRRYLAIFL